MIVAFLLSDTCLKQKFLPFPIGWQDIAVLLQLYSTTVQPFNPSTSKPFILSGIKLNQHLIMGVIISPLFENEWALIQLSQT
jgi:hypothetical protein